MRILPPSVWPFLDLHELWEYRDLLVLTIWRDLKVRYNQNVLSEFQRPSPGTYWINLRVSQKGVSRLDYVERAVSFMVVDTDN